MLPLYVFALVLGGGFLLVSLFGDALGADVDGADADLDGLHVDGDVHTEVHGDAGGWSKLFSIRSVIYALFGFGVVGTLLHLLRGGDQTVNTALFAATGGILSGALISALFGLVKHGESGARTSEDAFAGLLGAVTLPLGVEQAGQITVTQGVRTHRLPARVHPAADLRIPPDDWARVVVIEMDKGVALVAPADPELLRGAEEEEQ